MSLDTYIVIIYLVGLLALGCFFSRFNANLSDYIRGGARGTWWLAGTSMLLAATSAFTFTGNASAAFSAGPTFLVIYCANCCAYLICALFLGAWMRQTRAYTVADLLRRRFGPEVEQFNIFFSAVLGPFGAAVQLWALSLFASSVLDVSVLPTILAIGSIVILYSATGGRWAVMATDFAQGVLLFGVTAIVFVLSLQYVGGFGAFFEFFADPRFSEDFKFVKEPGDFSEDRFTWKWIGAIFLMQVWGAVGMDSAHRFLSIKDGREAKRASWLALVLMAAGTFIWFLPPMVARFMHEADILALSIKDPGNYSFAFLSQQLLPTGMMGLVVAAMFAATMSSMDTGLNNLTGIIANNLMPAIRRKLGIAEPNDRNNLMLCRVVTLILGVYIVGVCIALSKQERFPLFDAYLTMASVVGIPIAFPMTVGLWIKKLPRWSYFAMFGACLLPSIYSLYDEMANGNRWTIQDRGIWIFIFGVASVVVSRALYFTTSESHKNNLDTFFKLMRTPVDFEKEVGSANDSLQSGVMAKVCFIMSGGSLALVLVPNELWGRACFVALAAFMAVVGFVLHRHAADKA